MVYTDLQIQVPDGCYGRIAPRSGLAVKNNIDIGAGVVDQDFRGNIGSTNFYDSIFLKPHSQELFYSIMERKDFWLELGTELHS